MFSGVVRLSVRVVWAWCDCKLGRGSSVSERARRAGGERQALVNRTPTCVLYTDYSVTAQLVLASVTVCDLLTSRATGTLTGYDY